MGIHLSLRNCCGEIMQHALGWKFHPMMDSLGVVLSCTHELQRNEWLLRAVEGRTGADAISSLLAAAMEEAVVGKSDEPSLEDFSEGSDPFDLHDYGRDRMLVALVLDMSRLHPDATWVVSK